MIRLLLQAERRVYDERRLVQSNYATLVIVTLVNIESKKMYLDTLGETIFKLMKLNLLPNADVLSVIVKFKGNIMNLLNIV